jgi:hypothetical protein
MPLCSLTIVPASLRVSGPPRSLGGTPIILDHIVDDHSTIDAPPTMKVRRGSNLNRDAVVTDGKAVAS